MCQEENQRRDDYVVKNLISDNSEEDETWEPKDTSSYTFLLLDKERNVITKAEKRAEVLLSLLWLSLSEKYQLFSSQENPWSDRQGHGAEETPCKTGGSSQWPAVSLRGLEWSMGLGGIHLKRLRESAEELIKPLFIINLVSWEG